MDPPVDRFQPVLTASDHPVGHVAPGQYQSKPIPVIFLIPIFIGELLAEDKISVKVLRTNDTWYGMTYKEDVAVVKESFRDMLERGVYKEELFCDIK